MELEDDRRSMGSFQSKAKKQNGIHLVFGVASGKDVVSANGGQDLVNGQKMAATLLLFARTAKMWLFIEAISKGK